MSFNENKLLILIQSNVSIFFMNSNVVTIEKNHCFPVRIEKHFPIYFSSGVTNDQGKVKFEVEGLVPE